MVEVENLLWLLEFCRFGAHFASADVCTFGECVDPLFIVHHQGYKPVVVFPYDYSGGWSDHVVWVGLLSEVCFCKSGHFAVSSASHPVVATREPRRARH